MAQDKNRIRKTYSFFRPPPVYASGGGGGGGGGGGCCNPELWFSTQDDAIFTTGSVLIRGLESENAAEDYGTDNFFYVSGSIGAQGSERHVSVFGGDVVISGSLVTYNGLSGSLTRLPDGTSYLIAGVGIDIVSASNGAVTISSTIGGGDVYTDSFIQADLVSNVLNVVHNLNAQYVNVSVYDENNKLIIPDEVIATSVGTVDIDLSSFTPIPSTWHVFVASGQAPIYDQFWFSTTAGSIHTSGSAAFVGPGEWGIIDSPADKGTDVFFYVSGSSGSMGGPTPGVALFGGDVVISGSLKIGTGSVTVTSNNVQFSGYSMRVEREGSDLMFYDVNNPGGLSLTDLYTNAGSPGSPTNSVQYNAGGTFGGSANFTYDGTLYLSGSLNQGLINRIFSQYSHTEGYDSETNGDYSHAEGLSTVANGNYSHAEGEAATSAGIASHAEGYGTSANGDHSHAEGSSSTAIGTASHAEGTQTLTKNGADYSHAEGELTVTQGIASHAEGLQTYAEIDYSHAEGWLTTGSALYSHAEGERTRTFGLASHAEGLQTRTDGAYSHAEGYLTTGSGLYSHAEGELTVATGRASHAGGLGTAASANYQTVVGQYNDFDSNSSTLFIVGNGTSDSSRKTIFKVTTDGITIDRSNDSLADIVIGPETTYHLLLKNDNNLGTVWTWGLGILDDGGAERDLYFSYGKALGTPTLDAKGYISNGAGPTQMNFTGQHRSSPGAGQYDNFVEKNGYVVISAGTYSPISGSQITINDAVPIIELSTKRNDKRCFGVISDIEDSESNNREFGQGRFVSVYEKQSPDDNRVYVNSLGEGCIWICNINGNLENGDYITTCEIPGMGMKQDDDLLHNYTVAKITCDCDFDLNSTVYRCEEFTHEGVTYRRAFVGCTYHCG